MGEKSVQKKRYIVEKARDVFMEKGFKKVTMKDIVEACDISRGGACRRWKYDKVPSRATCQERGRENGEEQRK